jgi:PPM family protein phosphatase
VDGLTAAGQTDRGQIREHNEDHWFADAAQGLFIVSDGMGGRAAGELASQIVTDVLPTYFLQHFEAIQDLTIPAATETVTTILADLSTTLYHESSKRLDFIGMGATVVLAFVRQAHVLIAHVGDSRAYIWRDQQLLPLTTDHSLVQVLIDLGQLAPEEAATHPSRSQITQFIGMKGAIDPEVRILGLQARDRLLLCSDGLTSIVGPSAIAEVLQRMPPPAETCQSLINAANAAGGKDNITVIVVDWQPQKNHERLKHYASQETPGRNSR